MSVWTGSRLVMDSWAALSHKPALDDRSPNAPGERPKTWVGEHRRRLAAYMLLHAYRENVARWYVKTSSEDQRNIRREYGDSDLLVRQVAASVLGRGARIAVEGAEDATSGPAAARQGELDTWATLEQLHLKLVETEQQCLELGDVVLHATWSSRANRVRLRTVDPGFYFPVYPAGDPGDDYPDKVHLAWEFEEWDVVQGKMRTWVERVTYELVPAEPYQVAYQDEPATRVCLLTKARWALDNVDWTTRDAARDAGPDGFTPKGATYLVSEDGVELNGYPLPIDFIPLVHIPNFGGRPWGRSLLTSVAHILDDLQMADTDAAEAADVAGGPPIVVAGADLDTLRTYGPKTVWTVPTGGQASVLDTSQGLTALHEHIDFLYGRLTTNARVPEEILGRVGANEVPSGTALALSFSPFKVLVEELRLTRGHKYGLVLKMIQRMMIAGGAWKGPVVPAVLSFGAALPEDIHGLVSILKELASSDRPLISRITAIQALADAGIPIEDPAEEMERVHAEDFDAARLIGVATKSGQLAAEHLGLDLPENDPTMAKLTANPTDPLNENASDTVTSTEKTPTGSGAGTGTRNPGANSGSNSSDERPNGRRNRRGRQR